MTPVRSASLSRSSLPSRRSSLSRHYRICLAGGSPLRTVCSENWRSCDRGVRSRQGSRMTRWRSRGVGNTIRNSPFSTVCVNQELFEEFRPFVVVHSLSQGSAGVYVPPLSPEASETTMRPSGSNLENCSGLRIHKNVFLSISESDPRDPPLGGGSYKLFSRARGAEGGSEGGSLEHCPLRRGAASSTSLSMRGS